MKIANIVLIILFIFSAVIQFNDPDPYIWMPIYIFGAVLCYLSLKGRFNYLLYSLGLSVYTLYAIYLFFGDTGVWSWIQEHEAESLVQTMKATKPWIEETREFFGLLILILALLSNIIWNKVRAGKEKSPAKLRDLI